MVTSILILYIQQPATVDLCRQVCVPQLTQCHNTYVVPTYNIDEKLFKFSFRELRLR